jgi:bifunctional non-homologous end joining protein LigD
LLSWAVPKGPSLDPSTRRLATRVENHPIEYAEFEGVIPGGEYGAGTVMVWDNGSWRPEIDDVNLALQQGELTFVLVGKKLKGSWALVRIRGRGGRESWLLIKRRDSFASSKDITVTQAVSAVSRRTLKQIAQDEGGDVGLAARRNPRPASRKK